MSAILHFVDYVKKENDENILIVNIGRNDNNLKIIEIAKIIQNLIPKSKINFLQNLGEKKDQLFLLIEKLKVERTIERTKFLSINQKMIMDLNVILRLMMA